MDILLPKLIASPLLIWAATLAGRRWGQAVAGWFVGLPLTSGPVVLFIAIDRGPGFAAGAAEGSLAGTAAQAGFCIAYGLAAHRHGWPAALAAGSGAFAACAFLCQTAGPPGWSLLPIAVTALALALFLIGPPGSEMVRAGRLPRWDLPARMAVAAALVLGLTTAAPLLGPRLSGILATFPVFAAILAIFAHHSNGEAAARRVLRGLLTGLFGFSGFFFVAARALQSFGIPAAFAAACVVAVSIQAVSLWLLRRPAYPRRPFGGETRTRSTRRPSISTTSKR